MLVAATGGIGSSNPDLIVDEFASGAVLNSDIWTTYNDLADANLEVTVAGGRYHGHLKNNAADVTLFYNTDQGQLDAFELTFPFEVIATNIGIGQVGATQTIPPYVSNPFLFCGLQVHHTTFGTIDSSHMVVGHRGGLAENTVEAKNTNAGVSVVNDAGDNAATNGRTDLRVVGAANGTLTWYYGSPGSWTEHAFPGTQPTYGASVLVGIITYAQNTAGAPFVGTCDKIEQIS